MEVNPKNGNIEAILAIKDDLERINAMQEMPNNVVDMNKVQEAHDETKMSNGTVLVGVKTADSAVLVTDKKASLGGWAAERGREKTQPINDRFAMSTTGLASHGILMGEWLSRFINSYELATKEYATMKTVLQMYRGITFAVGGLYLASIIIGVDENGAHLGQAWALDPGFFSISPYMTIGSGSHFAKSILEKDYRKDMETMACELTQEVDNQRTNLYRKFVATQNEILSRSDDLKELSEKEFAEELRDDYIGFMNEVQASENVECPNDGLNLALEAATISAHEDNFNGPAIFTNPPYTVLIATAGRGLWTPSEEEVTLRYENIVKRIRRDRGIDDGYDVSKCVNKHIKNLGGGQ